MLGGPMLGGPMLGGPIFCDPMLWGPVFCGPMLGGPMFDGPMFDGPRLGGHMLGGPILWEPMFWGPMLCGPAFTGPKFWGRSFGGPILGLVLWEPIFIPMLGPLRDPPGCPWGPWPGPKVALKCLPAWDGKLCGGLTFGLWLAPWRWLGTGPGPRPMLGATEWCFWLYIPGWCPKDWLDLIFILGPKGGPTFVPCGLGPVWWKLWPWFHWFLPIPWPWSWPLP